MYIFGWFAKEIQDDNLAAPTSFFSCYVRCIRPLVNNDGQLFFCFVSTFKNIGKTFLSLTFFNALHKLLPHWRTSKRYELFLQLLHHPRDTLFLTLGYLINLPYLLSLWKFTLSKKATKIDEIFTVYLTLCKGQLISKCLLGVIVSTKKPKISLRISALASKKRLNQKMYYIKYVK